MTQTMTRETSESNTTGSFDHTTTKSLRIAAILFAVAAIIGFAYCVV